MAKQHRKAKRPELRRIHPDATYQLDPEARASLEYWRTRPTDEIIESLLPDGEDPLVTKADGRMMNGNTRTKVLEERGVDVDALPREVFPTDPLFQE